jgi:hypothetical protein
MYSRASRLVSGVHERVHSGDIDARHQGYVAAPMFEDDGMTVEVSFPEQLLIDAVGGAVPAAWRYRDLDADGQVELNPASTSLASLLPVSVIVRWTGGVMRANFLVTER